MKFIILLVAVFATSNAALSRTCLRYQAEQNSRADGTDVCENTFSSFLECLTGSLEKSVDHFISGAGDEAQYAASQCFANENCGPVTFTEKAALDAFLPCNSPNPQYDCKIRHAADLIIDILDDVPKPVAKCMVKYFKGLGARMIEQCTVDYPVKGELNPPLSMPEIPGFEDFELDEIKELVIYHLMVRHSLLKCKACPTKNAAQLIGCLTKDIKQDQNGNCGSRVNCENGIDGSCHVRYDKVHASTCTCAAESLKKGIGAIEDFTELKEMITKADWKCQLEICYEESGNSNAWPVMDRKIKIAKQAVIRAFLEHRTKGLPKEIMTALSVFKSIMDELQEKWSGVFCGTCQSGDLNEGELRAKSFRSLVQNANCNASPRPVPPRPQLERVPRPRPTSSGIDFDDFFD